MNIEMPDINMLLAMLDPMHVNHHKARGWYAEVGSKGWATCPLTENGLVRIISLPSYPGIRVKTETALFLLQAAVESSTAKHYFWQDGVSLRDRNLVNPAKIAGPKQITDVYLLALCQQNGGTLVTLDAKMTVSAIVSPRADLLRIL